MLSDTSLWSRRLGVFLVIVWWVAGSSEVAKGALCPNSSVDQQNATSNSSTSFGANIWQEFTTAATALGGASVGTQNNLGGAPAFVTIDLYDALPGQGGNLIARGTTDAPVNPGDTAVVSWDAVPVTAGALYVLNFSASESDFNIARDGNNGYAGGISYFGDSLNADAGVDYVFETFACTTPATLPSNLCAASSTDQENDTSDSSTPFSADIWQEFVAANEWLGGASVGTASNASGNPALVTVRLYDALPGQGGVQIATATTEDPVDPGDMAIVAWGMPIAVTPGATYLLNFSASEGDFDIARDGTGNYSPGISYFGAGFTPDAGVDYRFRTLACPNGLCVGNRVDQVNVPVNSSTGFGANIFQEFTTAESVLGGASVTTRNNLSGNPAFVTIDLYDALPNQGGTRIAGGTSDSAVEPGDTAIVWWDSVPVTPGAKYLLNFSASDSDFNIARDGGGNYAGGISYFGASHSADPNVDYRFQTFACPVPEPTAALQLLAALAGLSGCATRARRR